MDFVDEQHLSGIQRTENRGEIAGMLDGWSGGDANRYAKFVGHDHRKCGFAQARRTRKQNMVRRDFTLACCVQEQLKLGLEAWLSDEAIEYVWT